MLKQLRHKKVAKRIFWALAVVIIPAFVIWGSASVLQKDDLPASAGILFGRKVTFDEFHHALDGWRTQLKLQYGEKAEEIASAFFNPAEAAWDRLTLLAEVRRRKIKVGDAEVVEMIAKMPFLQKNGRFDEEAYALFLKYALAREARTFEEILRENLEMAKLFEEMTAGVAVSTDEIRREYERQNVAARIKYVSFPAAAYKNEITLSDEEVRAYHENNKDAFRIPPQINAAYVKIELKEDASDEVKRVAREKMKSVLNQARSLQNFEETAASAGLEIRETGLFGADDPVPILGWQPQLAALLFGLEANGMSKIIELRDGVYLFRINEKRESRIPDFSEAKLKASEMLTNQKSKDMARRKAGEFLASLGGKGDAYETTAEQQKLIVKETPFFSRDSYIPELGMAERFKEAAFKLKPQDIPSDVVESEQGFCVLKCIEIKPLDEEKFVQEKEAFSAKLLEEKRGRVFNEFFLRLKDKARLKNHVPEGLLKRKS